jgi:prepilin-type N-terminal cleavage/methylation domain-containing protein
MIGKRRGLTLVELLVTLAVVLALSALILPGVKSLLVDRKSTQSATIVRNFIEAARARAIGSNNSISVVLERVSSFPLDRNEDGLLTVADMTGDGSASDPYRLLSGTCVDPVPGATALETNFVPYNTCVRLSLAERPKPRASTMLPTWTATNVINSVNTLSGAGLIQGAFGTGHPQAGRSYFSTTVATGVANQITTELNLVAGSEISFGSSPIKFLITDTRSSTSGPLTTLWFTCQSSSSSSDEDELATPSLTPNSSYTTFVVYPKVRPIGTQSVTLPRGMCIDLSLSGFGEVGSLTQRDRRFRFSSSWLYGTIPVPQPNELRPVYLEFGPDGMLTTVFANGRGVRASQLVPVQTVDDVFLHVGKIDQVKIPALPAPGDELGSNLTDQAGYIVRIGTKSGSIVCAPVASAETQSLLLGIPANSVGNVLSLSRQGVLGQPLTGQ